MRIVSFALMLSIVLSFTGCGVLDRLRYPGLQREEIAFLTKAQAQCGSIKDNGGRLSFDLKPVVHNTAYGQFKPKVKSTNESELGAITALWDHHLCILDELDRSATSRRQPWAKEVGDAITDWPAFKADQFEAQIALLRQKRDQHLSRVETDYPAQKNARARDEVVLAAIPDRDYLHMREFEFEATLGETFKVKTLDLGKSSGKVCVSGDEISSAARIALQASRGAVVGIASGRMSEAEGLRLMLTKVYESGTQKLLAAREASMLAHAPKSCELPADATKGQDERQAQGATTEGAGARGQPRSVGARKDESANDGGAAFPSAQRSSSTGS